MGTQVMNLFVGIVIASCVLATAEQCNDYGLRADFTVPNPLIWEFYNFNDLGGSRGCFLCVEIPAGSSRYSRLILPCETSPISFTLSDFSYNEDDTATNRGITFVDHDIDCQTMYSSAPVDNFNTRTPREINLEGVRIQNYSGTVSYMPNRLYRIVTGAYAITHTVCIRSLTYTYPSMISLAGDMSSRLSSTTANTALPVSTRPALTTVVPSRNPLRTTPDPPAAHPVSTQPAGTAVVFSRNPLWTTLSETNERTSIQDEGSSDESAAPTMRNGTSSPSSELPPWIWIVAFLIIVVVIAAFAGRVILGRRGWFLGAPQTSSNSKTAPESDTISIAVAQAHVTSDASHEDVRNSTAYEVPNAPMESTRGKLTPGPQTDGARRADVGPHPPDESYEGIRYSDGYETPTNITSREDRVYYVNKGIVGVTNE